ncbi:MAG: MotA/TolQ/ExbB proton channel family protein [Oscillospiraceae bacterium]|jgi:chemotaxis protein MotA|nr:MotA/TolQ/ExbB proton channel family protein [Oscillospiraceae bacterium]
MNIATILGFVIAFGGILVGYILEGGEISALLLLSPALIVFGGTFGAAFISFNMLQIKSFPKLLIEAFRFSGGENIQKTAAQLEEMATLCRAKGILALESYLNEHNEVDPVMKRGATIMIDGIEHERLIETMEAEVDVIEKAEHQNIALWEAMAGFAPTMGVLGTVMGLVHTLGNMGEPSELTRSIASAFIATLYGVGIANILFMPIATKLKTNMKFNMLGYELMIRGIDSIQRGMNPRNVHDMCEPYLDAIGKLNAKSDK